MASISRLRAEAADCTRCDLYRDATQTVFGVGPAHPQIVMIGEQPGDKEDLDGHPFVGPAGQLLDRMLAASGIDHDRVYLTNAVKHFKWKRGNGKVRVHQKPNRAEVRACAPWWEAELATLQPELVVLLGATAAQAVLGPAVKVTRDRGRVLLANAERSYDTLVTVHPSAVLRMRSPERDEAFDALVRDLAVAAQHVARVTQGQVRVGCSGWVYRDWRGPVYPSDLPQRRWFESYATRFDTVELNATFYRLPTATAVEHWAEQAPPGFVYAAKLGMFGSHRMKLRDASSWLPNHLDRIHRLGRALGPTLVQLPPRWRRDVSRLDEFFAAAPSSLRWALEVRDESWLHDDVYAVLERHGAALCIHDLIERHPWVRTTDWTYVRFHGPDALTQKYVGRYGGRRLWRPAERLAEWADAGDDAYVYFNNDFDGAAVADATWFRDRVGPAARPRVATVAGTTRSGRAGPGR